MKSFQGIVAELGIRRALDFLLAFKRSVNG